MKKRVLVAIACAAVAGVALWLTFARGSDEDRIRKTLDDLGAIVAVKDGDTVLSRVGRLRSRMKDVVVDDVHANVSELGIDVRGRSKLEDEAARGGLIYSRAGVTFSAVSIKLDPAGTVATVDALAVVTAERGGERRAEKRDVHFLFQKDGDWKISTIDVAARKDD